MKYYTDASYSPQYKIGVLGFILSSNIYNVHYRITQGIKCGQCEIESFKDVLDFIVQNKDYKADIYTDCQNIIKLIDI